VKTFLKWCLAGILATVVAVVIFYLFILALKPFTNWLNSSFPVEMEETRERAAATSELSGNDTCTFSVSGHVTSNDGLPVTNAEIKIYNAGLYETGAVRFTDSNGRFGYNEIGTDICEKDQLILLIRKDGFQPFFMIAEPDQRIKVSLTSLYYF